MKKITLMIAIFAVSLVATESKSQVRFNVQVNVGNPYYEVRHSYNCEQFYYPEIGVYFNPANAEFIYWDCNRWNSTRCLPEAYYGYDFNRGYRVSVYGQNPWYRDNYYRQQYEGYRTAYYNRHREHYERDNRYAYHEERRHEHEYHEHENRRRW